MAGIAGVENKATGVKMLEQHNTLARHAVGIHCRDCHGRRIHDLHVKRLLHPLSKLIMRILAKISSAQLTHQILTSEIV